LLGKRSDDYYSSIVSDAGDEPSISCWCSNTKPPEHWASEPGIIAGTAVWRPREVEVIEEKRTDDHLAEIMAVAVEFGKLHGSCAVDDE
jgi:hypothetical protein